MTKQITIISVKRELKREIRTRFFAKCMTLNVSLDVLNFGDSMQMEKIIRSFETVLLHKHLAEQSRLATFKTDYLSINCVDFLFVEKPPSHYFCFGFCLQQLLAEHRFGLALKILNQQIMH